MLTASLHFQRSCAVSIRQLGDHALHLQGGCAENDVKTTLANRKWIRESTNIPRFRDGNPQLHFTSLSIHSRLGTHSYLMTAMLILRMTKLQ